MKVIKDRKILKALRDDGWIPPPPPTPGAGRQRTPEDIETGEFTPPTTNTSGISIIEVSGWQ